MESSSVSSNITAATISRGTLPITSHGVAVCSSRKWGEHSTQWYREVGCFEHAEPARRRNKGHGILNFDRPLASASRWSSASELHCSSSRQPYLHGLLEVGPSGQVETASWKWTLTPATTSQSGRGQSNPKMPASLPLDCCKRGKTPIPTTFQQCKCKNSLVPDSRATKITTSI